MAFLMHLTAINPNCSFHILGLILFLILCNIILRRSFIRWFMRLIVQCWPHSFAPGFLPSMMNIDLHMSLGISLILYIAFRSSFNSHILHLSSASNALIKMYQSPTAYHLQQTMHLNWFHEKLIIYQYLTRVVSQIQALRKTNRNNTNGCDTQSEIYLEQTYFFSF